MLFLKTDVNKMQSEMADFAPGAASSQPQV